MKLLDEIPVNTGKLIYEGKDLVFVSECTIQISSGELPIALDLKRSTESNIIETLGLDREELTQVSKVFNVSITELSHRKFYFEKNDTSIFGVSQVYFGYYRSESKQYLISFYYFETQPTVFNAYLDKVVEVE